MQVLRLLLALPANPARQFCFVPRQLFWLIGCNFSYPAKAD